jgi:predicted kinase
MEKSLIIIRGVQGSGKTTLAGMIMQSEGYSERWGPDDSWQHFEADMYFVNPVTGEYQFEGSKIGQAHRWCEHNVNKAMEEGKNVIVSNTFVTKKEYKVYLEMAEKHGYQVQEILCRGRFKNSHGVDEEKVEAKRKSFEY